MKKSFQGLPSFSLIKKDGVTLLLKNRFKDLLIRLGIEDWKTFLQRNLPNTTFFKGRTPHPSIPIREGMRIIIRQYSHGGLFRGLTQNLFFFGSRSFQELVLMEEVRACGIPTVEPIGAIHQYVPPFFYRSYLLTLEIPQAVDLIEYFRRIGNRPSPENLSQKRQVIRSVAILIRQFHQEGFFHGDLQLKNILLSGEQALLIDFDRSYRKQPLSLKERMKNLLRFNRSIEKWRRLGLPITKTDCWRLFKAYSENDPKIQRAIEKVVRTYSLRLFLYRLVWAVEGWVARIL
ncbi:MAG: lipopolysaccharide kinase InaA family protein [Thermodesulfobacteriota bacterium]